MKTKTAKMFAGVLAAAVCLGWTAPAQAFDTGFVGGDPDDIEHSHGAMSYDKDYGVSPGGFATEVPASINASGLDRLKKLEKAMCQSGRKKISVGRILVHSILATCNDSRRLLTITKNKPFFRSDVVGFIVNGHPVRVLHKIKYNSQIQSAASIAMRQAQHLRPHK